MPRLQGFPLANQLADVHEVNKDFDCVPTSIASCLEYLTGKQYDGGAIKDFAYGPGYQGGTAASAYVDYCKAQGVNLHALDGTPAQLIQDILVTLKSGNPLVVTEPSPYARPSLGWSHVIAMCGYDDPQGTLTAMDPWGGKFITLPESEWQARLEFNQVWVLEKIGDDMAIDIHSPNVGNFFSETAANQWVCKQNGNAIHDGMLGFYKSDNGLLNAGLPVTNELGITHFGPLYADFANSGIVVQFYERQVYCYDPDHKIDNPPGSGAVYPMHLYTGGPGTDPFINQLKNQIAQLQQQLAQAGSSQDSAKLAQIKTIVNS